MKTEIQDLVLMKRRKENASLVKEKGASDASIGNASIVLPKVKCRLMESVCNDLRTEMLTLCRVLHRMLTSRYPAVQLSSLDTHHPAHRCLGNYHQDRAPFDFSTLTDHHSPLYTSTSTTITNLLQTRGQRQINSQTKFSFSTQ